MSLFRTLDKVSGRVYLWFMFAEVDSNGECEDEPKFKLAKWYDLFLLLVPVFGVLGFVFVIEDRK